MKTLWIVSGGMEAVPGIKRAKELGLHVVVSDGNPQAPGLAIADDALIASTYDVEATVEAAKNYHQNIRPLDGVICIAADVPLTVAKVAQELGLPGIPIETARLATDKLAMKQRFVERGIAVPWFCEIDSLKHLKQIASERGLPLVLKPADSRGSRGVLKLAAAIDLVWAYKHAISFSPSGRVMVEEYLDGLQISTESILIEGKAFTPGFTDRNYEFLDRFAPYIIENGGHQPSILTLKQQRAVSQLAEQAASAMGITTWIAKGDMVLTDDGPKVIEIAARLSGGWFSTDQIPLATGVDLIGAAIKLAINEKVEEENLIPQYQKGVAIRYFFPTPGKVVGIKNAASFKKTSWVHKLGYFIKIGDIVEPVTNHTKRAGFVITTGETRDQAVERAIHIADSIRIETVPVIM